MSSGTGTFTAAIPRVYHEAPAEQTAGLVAGAAQTGAIGAETTSQGTVLVVDDTEANRYTIVRILQKAHFEVQEA